MASPGTQWGPDAVGAYSKQRVMDTGRGAESRLSETRFLDDAALWASKATREDRSTHGEKAIYWCALRKVSRLPGLGSAPIWRSKPSWS